MTRIIKAAETSEAPATQAGAATVLNLADFAAEARKVILDARKEAAEIVARAKVKADGVQDQSRRQGYDEGFARGQDDGYADGRRCGMEEARQKYQQEYAQVLAVSRQVAAELSAVRSDGFQRACGDTVEMAVALAEKIVCRVARANIEVAKGNLAKALELAHYGGQIVVQVNAGQLVALKEHFPRLAEALGAGGDVSLVGQDDISPGGVKLISPQGQIDATVETQLTNVAREMLGLEDAFHYGPLVGAGSYKSARPWGVEAPKTDAAVQRHESA
jgi:flagellar assembly protein FliH